jgi:hypothetical protein
MNQTKLKDLRVLAGRAEATITALKIGVDCWEPSDPLMKDRADRLALMIRELRQQIEELV